MSAAEKTGRVYFELSELDKEDGVRLNASRGTFKYDPDKKLEGQQLTDLEFTNDVVIGEKDGNSVGALISKLVKADNKTVAKDWTSVNVAVFDEKGRFVSETTAKKAEVNTKYIAELYDGYRVVISLTVDGQSAGEQYDENKANGDDVDDRLQPVITVAFQKAPGSSVYLNKTEKYVVDNGDNVAKLVSDEKYTDFPGWYDSEYDSKEDIDYIYAYEGDLTKVTKDIEIKANWVEDKEGLNRFSKVEAEEEKEYDELDANKDGVVSCEEALGKGWVWNNETSACELKGSSNTGSYVPNTATK